MCSEKNSIGELIKHYRMREQSLPLTDGSQNDFPEAGKAVEPVCRMRGCDYPDGCLLDDLPFEVHDVGGLCPRTVIRGYQDTPRGA